MLARRLSTNKPGHRRLNNIQRGGAEGLNDSAGDRMRMSDGIAGENCFQASDFANFLSALRVIRGLAEADATHRLVGDLFYRTLDAGWDLKKDTVIGCASLWRALTSAGVMTKVVALL